MKAIRSAVALLLLAALCFVGGAYFMYEKMTDSSEAESVTVTDDADLQLPTESEKRIVTVEDVQSKLTQMAELATYGGEYTVTIGKEESRYLLEKLEIWGTTNSIEITADGIVKVGYDLNDVKVVVDDFKIYLSLPEAKINDNYVIWDTVQVSEKNSILNPIQFSQYQEIITEIESIGLENALNDGIYEKAEENLKNIMNGFFSEFIDYEIVYM